MKRTVDLIIFLMLTLICESQEIQRTEKYIAFSVEDVLPTENANFTKMKKSYLEIFTKKCGEGIEAWSEKDQMLIETTFHPFVNALHYAYSEHTPFTISPDMIWLLIAQGFANHINENSEELKELLVDFEGKKVLEVSRDHFEKGSKKNNWQDVFPEFSSQIAKFTGKELIDLVTPKFSTTGAIEKAAFEISLLDALQSYFIYKVSSRCGINDIRLEGCTADWELVLENTKELRKYNLDWWVDKLVPVLEEFVKASNGNVDKKFWTEIYKYESGSGGEKITGWIRLFFPYIKVKGEPNLNTRSIAQIMEEDNVSKEKAYRISNEEINTTLEVIIPHTNFGQSLDSDSFSKGISKATFYWWYFGKIFQMEFLAGFIGATQDINDLAIRPEIGWAIRDTGKTGVKEEDSEYREEIER
ncbi:MAG: DUF4419 domain-containing protein [Candidatus Delongbacteria bacterium]|nr:DUF4419 domain-containing protein [Candidatus Delongbacteria bacterium]MBN2836185.1 DUF4419 domain-containing protein [Candidatus Delongbacteria bacterium]